MNLQRQSLDLSKVVVAAVETMRLAAEAKSLNMIVTHELCPVIGDEGRLQQIVWNLLSNAVKFTPAGGTVHVDLRAQKDNLEPLQQSLQPPFQPPLQKNSARLTVTDTGKGISAEFLPYMFEHFRQEDYSTTRKFGGLGLGLAISRQIVELHGGSISVDSPGENQGATFTVLIPLAAPLVESVSDKPSLNLPAEDLPADLSGRRILIVDDDADSLEITRFALVQAGATVIVASSGAMALTIVAEQVPNLIISDIGMPNMDGYTLMQQLRALPAEAGGNVKAIALTAYAGELDFKQALKAGFQRHITKPVAPDALVAMIKQVLNE